MIDRLVFLQRKSAVSTEAFARHWREVHGRIAARIPGLRAYHQYDPIARDGEAFTMPGGVLTVDGIALLVFDDLPAITAAFIPPIVDALVEDEQKFVSGLSIATTVANIVDRASAKTSPVRLISLIRRHSSVDAATFHGEWWRKGREFAAGIPGLAGYIQRIVLDRDAAATNPELDADGTFEGVEELCFSSEASLKTALASSALAAGDREGVGQVLLSVPLRVHRIV
jgi:uncharacterized protein (TIGR02118 family)